jgi:hypothetical protein
MANVGQCKICGGFYRMTNGRLPEHDSIKTGNSCRGRWPRKADVSEYTVGYDTMYGVYYGGAWELGRR